MIDRNHKLPVKRQCEWLELARSTAYYQPQGVCQGDWDILRRIDELHLLYPFAGSRTIGYWLDREGFQAGRRHVRTLMRRMGVNALYRKPRTSIPAPKATIYPYLLKDVCIEKPNHVWATDITYIALAKGSAYLAAILDLATRRVLAWRLSNTMSTDFCVEALKEALTRYGAPAIFNHRPGQPVHLPRVHQRAQGAPNPDQHGRQRPLDRQRVRGTALEKRQVRRRLSQRLRPRCSKRRTDSPSTSGSTTKFDLIKVLTAKRPMKSTSPTHRCPWQHNHAGLQLSLAKTCPNKRSHL